MARRIIKKIRVNEKCLLFNSPMICSSLVSTLKQDNLVEPLEIEIPSVKTNELESQLTTPSAQSENVSYRRDKNITCGSFVPQSDWSDRAQFYWFCFWSFLVYLHDWMGKLLFSSAPVSFLFTTYALLYSWSEMIDVLFYLNWYATGAKCSFFERVKVQRNDLRFLPVCHVKWSRLKRRVLSAVEQYLFVSRFD